MKQLKANNIAKALRAMRAWRGISQEALATKSGYASGTICAWEAGRTRPGLRARRDISEALYFSPMALDNLASGPDILERITFDVGIQPPTAVILGRDELAGTLGVAPTTIHKWTVQGHLRPVKDGRYRWYTDRDLTVARHLAKLRCRRSTK